MINPSKNNSHFQFIVNPISGIKAKNEIVSLIEENFKESSNYDVAYSEYKGHATEIARDAVQDGAKAVIAIGGDGSINEIGKALVNKQTPLGIIPAGSGNGFARHLQIPLNPQLAIQRIKQFNPIEIDSASVNGDPYFATLGIGFDAYISYKFDEAEKRGFKTYAMASLQGFMKYQYKSYQIEIDGKKLNPEAFIINIANVGQYGNNAWIAPTASVEDGLLNIGIIRPFPKRKVFDVVKRLFNKSLEQSPYYEKYLGREILIQQPTFYHLDGEPKKASSDLRISVQPKSLHLL